ncbi:hypothetical protein Tco_0428187 [Tanacetum coccineum]
MDTTRAQQQPLDDELVAPADLRNFENPSIGGGTFYLFLKDLDTLKWSNEVFITKTSVKPGVPDVPSYNSNDEQISWKSSDEEEDDEVGLNDDYDDVADENTNKENQDDDEQTDSDNDGDDCVHPKFSTHDDESRQEEVHEEDSFDLRVQTPSHDESTDDDNSDEEVQGTKFEEEEMVEEATHEDDEENELYRDVNVNLEGRDTVMTDAPLPNVQASQETKYTHVILTAPINPKAVSSIPGIVDTYLANKMQEAIKTAVLLQSERLKDEAQAENEDFLNKLDDNIKKIIKDQVKEQTSHVVAANLSELEPKKILIDKMEANKSIDRSDTQKNLYKALVDAYDADKDILDAYGDTVTIKQRRDDADDDEEPSTGSNRGSKKRRAGKELELTSAPKEKTSKTAGKSTDGFKSQHKNAGESAHTEEPMHIDKDLEEPAHQEFDIGATKEQYEEETSHILIGFKNQPSFLLSILMDTPLDFSAFIMNRLKIDTLTPELLVGPTFELMKGTCKSLVELEYFFEEVYKETIEQLDWYNPEGLQYPHDLRKPLPLIPNSRGRQVIPFDHFIYNDMMQYLLWVSLAEVPVNYDKHALWGISHWGRKRQQFYGFAANRESARDVNPNVESLQLYKDILNCRMARLQTFGLDHRKLTNLNVEDRLAFGVSLRMFTRSIIIQRRIEDLQLGIESSRKKLNITKPDTYRSDLKQKDAYTVYSYLRGFIYLNKDKKNRLMRIDELHKFSNSTLDDVRTALNDRLKGIRMEYIPKTIWRQSDRERAKAMI